MSQDSSAPQIPITLQTFNVNSLLFGPTHTWTTEGNTHPTITYSFLTSLPTKFGSQPGQVPPPIPNGPLMTSGLLTVKGFDDPQRKMTSDAINNWAVVANFRPNNITGPTKQPPVADINLITANIGLTTGRGFPVNAATAIPSPGSDYLSGYVFWNSGLTNVDNAVGTTVNPKIDNRGTSSYWSLLHEIGHALGLSHADNPNAVLPASENNWLYTVMSINNTTNTLTKHLVPITPMMLDIATIQNLYGAGPGYNIPVWTFTDSSQPFSTSCDSDAKKPGEVLLIRKLCT